MRSEVNLVSLAGLPPVSGCSQILLAPSRVNTYSRLWPSGAQYGPRKSPGMLNVRKGSPPFTDITTSVHPGAGVFEYRVYGYAKSLPSGETFNHPAMLSPRILLTTLGAPPFTEMFQIFCGASKFA